MATHPDNPKISTDISVNDIDRAFDDGAPSDIAKAMTSGTAMPMLKNTAGLFSAQKALEPLQEAIRNKLLIMDTTDLSKIYELFKKLNEIRKADYTEWIQKISALLEISTPAGFESMDQNECQYYVEQLVDYIKNQQVIVGEKAGANTSGEMRKSTSPESASAHSLDTQKASFKEDPPLLRRSTDHRPAQISKNDLDPDGSALHKKGEAFFRGIFHKLRGNKEPEPRKPRPRK